MKILGIAGKTGSGKSTVARYLSSKLQYSEIIDVDIVAKEIYKKNENILKNLKICFGEEVVGCRNSVDFKILGNIVFADCGQMQKLNSMMFPLIECELKRLISQKKEKANYLIIDAAILFDIDIYKFCSKIILVESSLKNRRNRLIEKYKNMAAMDIENRLKNQKIKIIRKKVDFFIKNDSNFDDLKKQLDDILKFI